MKVCTKCGEAKLVTEFGKDAQKRDGLCSSCKACKSIASAASYAANPEKHKTYLASAYAADPDKFKAKCSKYYVKNAKKVIARAVIWAASNPDKVRAAMAKWNAKNSSVLRIYRINRRAREEGGKLSKNIAGRLFRLQRGKCACCKQPLGDDYHLDHIMPLALGGANTDDNIQLLRAKCNKQKHAKHPVDFMQQRGFLL